MNSACAMISDHIRRLKPGEQVQFTPWVMKEAEPRSGGTFALAIDLIRRERGGAVDRILDGNVGSAYEYGVTTAPDTGIVTVYRLKEPLPSSGTTRTHVSADRRHHYRHDGYRYTLIKG